MIKKKKIPILVFLLTIVLTLSFGNCTIKEVNTNNHPLINSGSTQKPPQHTNTYTLPSITSVPSSTTPDPQTTKTINDVHFIINRHDSLVDGIFLFDVQLNTISKMEGFLYPQISTIRCQLTSIYDNGSGFVIKKIGFFGDPGETKFALEDRKTGDPIYGFSISPTEKWLAYLEITGEWGMSYSDAETQDIKLLKIDTEAPQKAQQLTKNGGARQESTVWSPDSRYLAYTDFDKDKIMQVFIYDLIGNEKTQLSNFGIEKRNHLISEIKWSPTSDSIAFVSKIFIERDNHTTHIANGFIYSVETMNIQSLDQYLPDASEIQIWWGDNDRILLLNLPDNTINEEYEYSLTWVQPKTKTIDRVVTHEDLNNYSVLGIYPLSSDLNNVFLVGIDQILYDYRNHQLKEVDNYLLGGIYDVIKTSSGFLQSPGCK